MVGFEGDEGSRVLVERVCLLDSGVAGMIGDGEVVLAWIAGRLLRCWALVVEVEERSDRRVGICGGWRRRVHHLEDKVKP